MSSLSARASIHGTMRRLIAATIFLMCLIGSTAHAQHRRRVVLLEPPQTEKIGVELYARLRGELVAAGFDVVLWPVTEVEDSQQAVETTARELQPTAVLLVRLDTTDPNAQSAELWVSDRLLRRLFVQRVTFDEKTRSRGAARLAVQAVELLKARLAELSVSDREPKPKPAPTPEPTPRVEPAPPPPEPPPRHASGFAVQIAAGLLHGFDEVDAVWSPVVRVGVTLPELGDAPIAIDVRGSLAAFGQTATVSDERHAADVDQSLGTLDAVVRFAPKSWIQPLMALGAGAYSTRVAGRADSPYVERTLRTWSVLNAASAGVVAEPVSGLTVNLEAALLSAWSGTVVRLTGNEVAESGTPMLLLSAGLGGVF